MPGPLWPQLHFTVGSTGSPLAPAPHPHRRGLVVELLPILGIALLFWFMIVRPQQKQRKAVQSMQASLEPGNEVMLTSGVYGTISRIEDEKIWVDVAAGVTLTVAKGAVGQVVQPQEVEPAADREDDQPSQDA